MDEKENVEWCYGYGPVDGDNRWSGDAIISGVSINGQGQSMKTVCMVLVLGLMVAGSVGCDRSPQDSEEDQRGKEYHSPFIITAEDDFQFEKVTFTDVGLAAPDDGPAEQFVLEAIAESLAYELNQSTSLDFRGGVEYEEELRDPDNHLFCDRQHLYVALWRGYDPDRWGYSLWSGCHEQQQFAWEEVPDSLDEKSDILTRVEPLTASIVEDVEVGVEENCFSQNC